MFVIILLKLTSIIFNLFIFYTNLANGEILLVDSRASSRKAAKTVHCFSGSLGTVSLHPENTNLCLVCSVDGYEVDVFLWFILTCKLKCSLFNRETGIFDLRFPSSRTAQLNIPLVSFPQCSKEITSAFFSPITGRYVLQTCMDHTLKLFEVQEPQGQAKCKLESSSSFFVVCSSVMTRHTLIC